MPSPNQHGTWWPQADETPSPARPQRSSLAAERVLERGGGCDVGVRRVAVGMALHPLPCARHDRVKIGMLRCPTKLVANPGGTGDQNGCIAFPTGSLAHIDSTPSNAPRRLDDFAHAESVACPEVVDQRSSLRQRIQRENVSLRQIANVNVIANTRGVGRWIIGAKDGHEFALTSRGLQYQGNQMRLRVMTLA